MKFKDKYVHKFYAFALAAVFALVLAGCGGGGGGTAAAPDPEPPPMPTAYEQAVAAIAAAETAEAAQAAVDAAVAAGITGAELRSLNMKAAERTMALAAAAAAAQRKILVEAAMCVAATQECVAAHDALIEALEADLAALQASDDATNAEEKAAMMAVAAAKAARAEVAMALEDDMRDTETGMKVTAAEMAAEGLEDARTAEDIAAAEEAIEAAKMAIAAGDDPDAFMAVIEKAETAVARAKELNAIDAAIMKAVEAADGLVEDSDAAAVAAAQALIDAAKALVVGNEHLTDTEEASYTGDVAGLQRTVTVAKNRNDEAAEKEEAARKAADEEEQRKADEAMAATAKKLYAGISAQMGTGDADNDGAFNTLATSDRDAIYNAAGTAILLSIGDGSDTAHTVPTATLSEDKKTTVAANHGWAGKRYADPPGGVSYEAFVYSNVEAPKEGRKFGNAEPGSGDGRPFEYDLTAAGVLTVANAGGVGGTSGFDAAKVAFTGVTRTAGTETFKLPDPNPTGETKIPVPGSYHGVSGTYSCDTGDGTSTCTATVATKGFTLGGTGTWTFKPGDPTAKVISPDTSYASYGWWIRKSTDGKFTASAFVDEKGTDSAAASGLDTLNGTATYMGGAAGKYALYSATGGTNDAGHFTARATLEADFTNNTAATAITGTIDMFIGADGEPRDWSVKLNGSTIADGGGIGAATKGTVWTIGETAAAAADENQWTGSLRENGKDGVPKVATGTFYSEYNNTGKMVGAFGATRQ